MRTCDKPFPPTGGSGGRSCPAINCLPAIGFVLAPDGAMEWLNADARRIFSRSDDEVAGLNFYEFLADDSHRETVREALAAAFAGNQVHDIECPVVFGSGEPLYLSVNAAPVLNEDGTLGCVVAVAHDVTRMHATARALRANEELFTKAFHASPAMLTISTLVDGRFIDSNESFLDATGWTHDELLGKTVEDIQLWADPEERKDVVRLLKEHGRVENKEIRFRTRSGEIRYALFSAQPIMSGAEACMLAVGTDITENKQTERLASRLGRILEQTSNEILVFDACCLRFTQVNQGARRNLGYTMAEMKALTFSDLLDAYTPEQVNELLLPLMNGRAKYLMLEFAFRRRDGSTYPVDIRLQFLESETPPVFVVIAQDLTEVQRLTNELERVEMQWNLAIEFFADPIYVVDMNDRVIRANRAFYEFTGKEPKDFIGQDITRIMHPNGDEALCSVCAARRAREDTFVVMEADAPFNNFKRPVEVMLRMIRGEDGEPMAMLMGLRDLTRQREIEQELKRHRDHLEELVARRTAALASSNRDLEAFSYSISHDLRGPLRSIDGFSQILVEEYGDRLDENALQYLQRVRKASHRMSDLIDGLLSIAKISRRMLNRESVNLSRLVTEIAEELRNLEPEREVEWVIRFGVEVRGDARLLRAALENLLRNAWKYTARRERGRIEFGVDSGPDGNVYFVRDNGVGFDMQYYDKLFNAFERLHHADEFEGNGIGLATVQRIISRHDGKIWAESAIGAGATFYFTLQA